MLRITCFLIVIAFNVCLADPVDHVTPKPVQAKVAAPQPLIRPRLNRDTTIVAVRKFDASALNAYKKLPEFKYKDNLERGPSLWTRFWSWFWGLFDTNALKGKKANTFFQWVFIVLKYLVLAGGAAALIFLILKAAGIDLMNVFRRKAYAALAYSESAENIHEIDFDNEIENAVAVHNYRLAVRLLYLKSLKQLSDNGLINWQLHKTNTNYIDELTDDRQRDEFKQLTRQFEYVWYGDFLIDGDIFKRINGLFHNFKSSAA